MANFTKGHTWTEHEIISPTSYNNLVDLANLGNVWNNVLDAATIRIPWLVDAIGSPVTGDIRVPAAFLLELYFSGIWNAQEAEPASITLQNNSAVNLLAGDVVCADPASAGGFIIPTIKDDPVTTHPLGVLLDDTNAGASGRVCYHGPVVVKGSGLSLPVTGHLFTLTDKTQGGSPVYNQAIATAATDVSVVAEDDRVFGIFLDEPTGSGLTSAWIWK